MLEYWCLWDDSVGFLRGGGCEGGLSGDLASVSPDVAPGGADLQADLLPWVSHFLPPGPRAGGLRREVFPLQVRCLL